MPQGDHYLLRIRFVDTPVTWKRPQTLTFGLQAWPIKPWPEQDWNVSNYLTQIPRVKAQDDGEVFNRSLGRTLAEFRENVAKAQELGMNVLWVFRWNAYNLPGSPARHPPEYPVLLAPEVERRVETYAAVAHKAGLPVIGHVGFALPPTAPVFEHYGKEMAVHPIVNKGIFGYLFSAHSPFADAWVHGFKKLAQEVHWSGVQLDGAFTPRYNESEPTGAGMRDDQGRLHGRFPIFATRDFARRLYNVYHGEVEFPDIEHGFVYCHETHHAFGAIHGFCDALYSGEERQTMLVPHLSDIDLDRERALYASGALGVPRHLLSKMPKAPVGPRGRIAFALQLDLPPAHNRILRWVPREDYRPDSYPAHRVWAARKWIEASPETFVWYDESDAFVQVDTPGIYTSLHVRRGDRALIALSNWTAKDVSVRALLNLAALGLAADQVRADDAITGEPLELTAGTLPLAIGADGYRLVKLWVP